MLKINYKELKFWKLHDELDEDINKIIDESFPQKEMKALSDQLRRASLSVLLNIAEGSGKSTMKDFKQFLYRSRGSAKEVEVCLYKAKRRGYIEISTYDRLTKELDYILGTMTNYMKTIIIKK